MNVPAHWMHRCRLVLYAGVIASIVACAPASDGAARDERLRGEPSAFVAPTLELVPIADLQDEEGEPLSVTHGALALLDNGHVVTASPSEYVIRRIDSSGTIHSSVGRQGAGPSEFQFIERLVSLPHDSVAIVDAVTRRITFWVRDTLQPASLSLANWPRTMGAHQVRMAGRMADGRWVALVANDLDLSTQADRLIVDTPYVVAGHTDAPPVRLLTLPPRRLFSSYSPSDGWTIASLFSVAPAQFAVCDSGIMVVDTSGVRTYDRTGALTATHPLAVARTARTPGSDADRRLRDLLTDGDYPNASASTRQQLRAWYDALDSTMHMPVIDRRGVVWYDAPPPDSQRIVAFTADGKPRGTVRGRVRIVQATADHLVTATWDDTLQTNHYSLQAMRPAPRRDAAPLGTCSPALTF